jgi:uncharacterized protein
MKIRLAVLAFLVAAKSASAQAPPPSTPAGIVLDAPWKESVFKFATDKLQHSAWGVSHSERDYLLATRLAAESKLEIDQDVLFAAAFLHDVGAFDAFRREGVDHTDRAAELVPDILEDAGFPATKIPMVQDAVKNHMYYRADAKFAESIVLHDADTLDFLGTIGIARILSLTTRHRWATDLATAAKTLDGFNNDLPPKLLTAAAKKMAPIRTAESRAFLDVLKTETEDGKAR